MSNRKIKKGKDRTMDGRLLTFLRTIATDLDAVSMIRIGGVQAVQVAPKRWTIVDGEGRTLCPGEDGEFVMVFAAESREIQTFTCGDPFVALRTLAMIEPVLAAARVKDSGVNDMPVTALDVSNGADAPDPKPEAVTDPVELVPKVDPSCPDCGAGLWRDEVEIGVGTMSGPWRCSECPWGEEGPLSVLEESPDSLHEPADGNAAPDVESEPKTPAPVSRLALEVLFRLGSPSTAEDLALSIATSMEGIRGLLDELTSAGLVKEIRPNTFHANLNNREFAALDWIDRADFDGQGGVRVADLPVLTHGTITDRNVAARIVKSLQNRGLVKVEVGPRNASIASMVRS